MDAISKIKKISGIFDLLLSHAVKKKWFPAPKESVSEFFIPHILTNRGRVKKKCFSTIWRVRKLLSFISKATAKISHTLRKVSFCGLAFHKKMFQSHEKTGSFPLLSTEKNWKSISSTTKRYVVFGFSFPIPWEFRIFPMLQNLIKKELLGSRANRLCSIWSTFLMFLMRK